MARYCGKVGYAISAEETAIRDGVRVGTGVWSNTIVEKLYYGDYMRNPNARWVTKQDGRNDDLDIANCVSIVGDHFALDNLPNIKYAEYMGTKWRVTSFEIEYPRIILTLGGVYNGEEPSGSTD